MRRSFRSRWLLLLFFRICTNKFVCTICVFDRLALLIASNKLFCARENIVRLTNLFILLFHWCIYVIDRVVVKSIAISHNKFCLFRLKNLRDCLRNSSRNLEIKYLTFDNLLSSARPILLLDWFSCVFCDDNDRRYARDDVQFADVLKIWCKFLINFVQSLRDRVLLMRFIILITFLIFSQYSSSWYDWLRSRFRSI